MAKLLQLLSSRVRAQTQRCPFPKLELLTLDPCALRLVPMALCLAATQELLTFGQVMDCMFSPWDITNFKSLRL